MLIEPVTKGAKLSEEIERSALSPGRLLVWWLGQSGFVIKSESATLVIDPYLSESLTEKYRQTERPHVRMTECPLSGDQLRSVDLVLSSHKHTDHMDKETLSRILGANPGAELVVPEALVHHAEKLGLPLKQIVGLDAGGVLESAGFSVRAIPSAHEGLDTDDAGRFLYLGFVVEVDGFRLYHSGDTVIYDGLSQEIGTEPFDLFFLPINGRDPKRGVAGNMNAAEGVALSNRLHPRFLVPHHYDMFTFNTVPIREFEVAARELSDRTIPKILSCGERWEIGH